MKKLLIIALCMFSLTCISQDYTLNGQLGIGTTPEAELDVAGDGRIQGDAKIEGELRIPELSSTALDYPKLLFTDENGRVRGVGDAEVEWFAKSLYKFDCKGEINGEYTPFWKNKPNVLYVKDGCVPNPRVGIDIEDPESTLHVIGDGIISNIETIDSSLVGSSQLLVHRYNGTESSYGIRTVTTQDHIKAMAVSRYDDGEDVFRVMVIF